LDFRQKFVVDRSINKIDIPPEPDDARKTQRGFLRNKQVDGFKPGSLFPASLLLLVPVV